MEYCVIVLSSSDVHYCSYHSFFLTFMLKSKKKSYKNQLKAMTKIWSSSSWMTSCFILVVRVMKLSWRFYRNLCAFDGKNCANCWNEILLKKKFNNIKLFAIGVNDWWILMTNSWKVVTNKLVEFYF